MKLTTIPKRVITRGSPISPFVGSYIFYRTGDEVLFQARVRLQTGTLGDYPICDIPVEFAPRFELSLFKGAGIAVDAESSSDMRRFRIMNNQIILENIAASSSTYEMSYRYLTISPPPRFLARFSRRLRALWGGRSETHTDHTQRHRLARPSALGHRWKCHLRNHPPRAGDRWWYGRRYLDSQNPGESNTCNLGSFSNVQRGDNKSSIGLLPDVFPVPHRHIQGVVRDGVCEHRRRESVYQLDYRRPYSIEDLCDIRRHADVGRFRYIPHDVPRPAGVTVGGAL